MRPIAISLLLTALSAVADESKPPDPTPDERNLAADAQRLHREGYQHYQQGQFAEAVEKLRAVLEWDRKRFPAARYPDGHPNIAACLNNLGFVLRAAGQAEQALDCYRQSLAMCRTLFPAQKYPA